MWTILLVGYFLTWALIPRVLLAKRRPVSALAWTWSIILFPYLGPLAYFVFGIERITRKRLELRAEFGLSKLADPGLDEDARKVAARITELTAEKGRTVHALSRINELAPSTADEIRLLTNAESFYDALKARIASARHHVHIQFFIVRSDEYGRAAALPRASADPLSE